MASNNEIESRKPKTELGSYRSFIDIQYPLVNSKMLQIIKKFGEKIVEWTIPEQKWVVTKVRVVTENFGFDAGQEITDYLTNGPSEKSPEGISILFLLKSPNPPIERGIFRIGSPSLNVPRSINVVKLNKQKEVEPICYHDEVVIQHTADHGSGFFRIQYREDAINFSLSQYFLKDIKFTNYDPWRGSNFPSFLKPEEHNTENLFALIELGDVYHLARERAILANNQLGEIQKMIDAIRKSR